MEGLPCATPGAPGVLGVPVPRWVQDSPPVPSPGRACPCRKMLRLCGEAEDKLAQELIHFELQVERDVIEPLFVLAEVTWGSLGCPRCPWAVPGLSPCWGREGSPCSPFLFGSWSLDPCPADSFPCSHCSSSFPPFPKTGIHTLIPDPFFQAPNTSRCCGVFFPSFFPLLMSLFFNFS